MSHAQKTNDNGLSRHCRSTVHCMSDSHDGAPSSTNSQPATAYQTSHQPIQKTFLTERQTDISRPLNSLCTTTKPNKVIRTPSPPKIQWPTLPSEEKSPKLDTSKPQPAQSGYYNQITGTNFTRKTDHTIKACSQNGLNTNFQSHLSHGFRAGSCAKTRLTSSAYLRLMQATPSLVGKSISAAAGSGQKDSGLSIGSPFGEPVRNLCQSGIVVKLKELQKNKTYCAEEVEDEEEEVRLSPFDEEEDDEREDGEETGRILSSDDVHTEEDLTLSNGSSEQGAVYNKILAIKSKNEIKKQISKQTTSSSTTTDKNKFINRYKELINASQKENDLPKERLRPSKSEPDLHSTDLSNMTSDSGNSNNRRYQDSIRMYHKHAMKKSESQQELRDQRLKSLSVKGKEYVMLNLLGQGGSSMVYQVYDPQKQQVYAIKIVDLRKVDASIRISLRKEIDVLNRLRNCKRVVRLIDHEYDESGGRLSLVMEKGDSDLGYILKQFLETDGHNSLDPVVIKFYWKEMLKAVDEIHSNGVVHSDLKPVNFISVGGKLKLIDFGISDSVEEDHTSVVKDAQIGTVNFMPPEALTAAYTINHTVNAAGGNHSNHPKPKRNIFKLSYKSDIWSLGCILYNLIYGRPPFAHLVNVYSKIQAICDTKHVIQYPPTRHLHAVDCLKQCLQRKAQDRPSARELLQHPFLNDEKKLPLHLKSASNSSSDNRSVNKIINQLINLTPRRLVQLEKITQQMVSKK